MKIKRTQTHNNAKKIAKKKYQNNSFITFFLLIMPGGIMQLVSTAESNVVLNGNPTKSFYKTSFHQYTNFAMQKFRVDYEGSKSLRLSEESTFTFKIPRYADLLADCYLSIALPTIWSPIMPPQEIQGQAGEQEQTGWAPYEFRWIENIGAKMISKISYTCGNYTLQEYSGDYLLAAVQRDFSAIKRLQFDEMIGNTPELNDPGNAQGRINAYPNAFFLNDRDPTDDPQQQQQQQFFVEPEPSIRGRILYVPLNGWFNIKTQQAFPLTALQYNELHINVTFRPINQLFTIRDVFDVANNYPIVAPNFNTWYMQFYRFVQPPPDVNLAIDSYQDQRSIWNADIHLNCTYVFLSNLEQQLFAANEQKYIMKQVYETVYPNVTGPNKVELYSIGMVANWLFYFQRSDANLRNQWSNYTNWPYNYKPLNVMQAPTSGSFLVYRTINGVLTPAYIGPGVNVDGTLTGYVITYPYSPENAQEILLQMGILLDGEYRENMQPAGVFNYIEKYVRTSGYAPIGLYCYNYSTNSNNASLQPSGAINMSEFAKIELEFNTILPPLNPFAQSFNICDAETGNVIGVNKPTWRIYDYNYDLHFFEERINVVHFMAGNVGLAYAT